MIKSKGSLGAIALALGGLALTCAADGPDGAARAGGKAEAKAVKALAHRNGAAAVNEAERAVALAPRDAAFRMVLGQSYLQAGRFAAARAAFADTLVLDPANGKAALDLALAQTALGDWQAARETLAAHADRITDGDRGLALALAGDTQGAVTLLTAVARAPGANAKARQNLALAYALAGQWQLARVVASADMSPAAVDARLEQWAAFARPHAAADQVASLMGVHPAAADAGQPATLALAAPAMPAPVALAPAPVAVAAGAPADAPVTAAVPAAVVALAAAPGAGVTFAPRHEVVQPLPVALIARAPAAFKTPFAPAKIVAAKPATAAPSFAKSGGGFVVQLGAYADMAVAKHAWSRASAHVAAFAGHQAQGVTLKTRTATLFRLSVGGFNRAGADQLCRRYRAQGGACFVRATAGDQLAHWAAPGATVAAKNRGEQVASR